MPIKIQKNLQKIQTQDHAAIDRLIDTNVTGKLDSYLKHYDKKDVEVRLSLNLEEIRGEFEGTLRVQANGDDFISERKKFHSLADLVNHLFDHIKEQMANKK